MTTPTPQLHHAVGHHRGESYYGSHSIESTIYRMLHVGNNLNWDSRHLSLTPIPAVHEVATALGAIVIAFAFWSRQSSTQLTRLLDFGIAYMAIIVASPVSYGHHFGLSYILLPATAFWAITTGSQRRDVVFIGVSYACLSNVFPVTDWLANTDLNVFQSYRLLGAGLLIWQMNKLRASRIEFDRQIISPFASERGQALMSEADPKLGSAESAV